jgi:hypothetical protein
MEINYVLMIGGCSTGFAVISWLLWLSFLVGRYAAHVDALTEQMATVFRKLESIDDKLDRIAVTSVHQCIQAERITRIETRVAP